jgi:lysophospholipase L1-like esterase
MLRVVGVCSVIAAGAILMSACGDEVQEGAGPSNSGGGVNAGGSSGDGGGGASAPMTASECLSDHHLPVAPEYDQYEAVMGSHCKGTNHQDITGVEKLVFVGDSITQGTFPSTQAQFYRTILGDKLSAKFPGLEIVECAADGARVDDLAGQLADTSCIGDVEPKTTLVVTTIGGNDLRSWAEDDLSDEAAMADAVRVAGVFRNAVAVVKDETKFPAGAFLIFANPYEFTDGTADLDSCPLAGQVGLTGTYYAGAVALSRLDELFMEIAVDTQTDMIFMGEEFCGHGWNRTVNNTCFLGPDAELWFDLSCYHPNPTGHNRIAELFELVVDE